MADKSNKNKAVYKGRLFLKPVSPQQVRAQVMSWSTPTRTPLPPPVAPGQSATGPQVPKGMPEINQYLVLRRMVKRNKPRSQKTVPVKKNVR